MAKKYKPGEGRPPYQPTQADRNTVSMMVATGFPLDAVRRCIGEKGVNYRTLVKYFKHEIDTAADKANAQVANRCYEMAKAGDPPAATFFWLKCRVGWREVQELGISGPGGSKLEVVFVGSRPEAEVIDITSVKTNGHANGHGKLLG